jgi:hypothetical protein
MSVLPACCPPCCLRAAPVLPTVLPPPLYPPAADTGLHALTSVPPLAAAFHELKAQRVEAKQVTTSAAREPQRRYVIPDREAEHYSERCKAIREEPAADCYLRVCLTPRVPLNKFKREFQRIKQMAGDGLQQSPEFCPLSE